MSRAVVKKGDPIMREQPLVLIQTLSSRKGSLNCSYCMADIGYDWSTQADIIIALHKSPSVRDTMGIEDESLVFAELDSIVDLLIAEGCAFGCPHRFRGLRHVCDDLSEDIDSSMTSTDLGRGHTCSDDCSHHGCDDSSSTSSMMHDFTAHATRTNEIFFAVRRVLTTLISCCTTLSIEIMHIDDVIDWFLGCFPLIVTDNSSSCSSSSNEGPLLLDKNTQCEMNDEAEESWLLLFSALVSEKHVSVDRYGKLLSRECFSRVLLIANQHLHSLVINVSRSDHSSVVTHLLNYLSNRRHAVVDVDDQSHATTIETYMEKLLEISNCGVGGDVAVRETLRSENTLNLIADLSDSSSLSSSSSTGVLHHRSSSGQPLFPTAIKHTGPVCMVLLTQCSKASRHSCLPNAAPCLSSRTHSSDGIEAISWEDDLLSFLSIKGVVVPCRTDDHNSYGKQQLPSIDLVALRPFVLESTQTSSDGSFILNSEPVLVSYVDHTSQSSDASVEDKDGDEDRYTFTYRSRWMQLYSRTKMVNKCYCTRCRYEEEIIQKRERLLVSMSVRDIIILAHFYMQQAVFSVAKRLYYTAIHRIETTPHVSDDDSSSSNADCLGDAYHALGAVYLECMGGQQWEMARYVWMRGAATICMMSRSHHALLASEVDKIRCYPSQRVHVMKAPMTSSICIVDAFSSILQGGSEIIRCCNLKGHTVAVDITMECSYGLDYSLYTEVVSGADSSSHHQLLPTCVAVDSTVCMTNDPIPLLSGDECAYMVREAELYCASGGGWSTSRHYGVPTTDIPVHCLRERRCRTDDPPSGDSVLSLFNDLFSRRLAPLLAIHFPSLVARSSMLSSDVLDPVSVHVAILDAFIVKYASSSAVMDRVDEDTGIGHSGNHRCQDPVIGESASQVFLPLHTDQSSHSFIIPLNASSEYTGGGTYFPSLDCILLPGVGQALIFPGGSILHGGQPITAGTRYILAVFAYMTSSIGGMTSDASAAITCQSEFDRECSLSSATDVRLTDDLHATTRFIPLLHDTCTTEGSHCRVKRPRVSLLVHDAAQEDRSNESSWMERSQVGTCPLANLQTSLDDGRSTFTFGFNVP